MLCNVSMQQSLHDGDDIAKQLKCPKNESKLRFTIHVVEDPCRLQGDQVTNNGLLSTAGLEYSDRTVFAQIYESIYYSQSL